LKANNVDKSTMQGIGELPRDALIRVLSLTEGDEERCASQYRSRSRLDVSCGRG